MLLRILRSDLSVVAVMIEDEVLFVFKERVFTIPFLLG